MERSGEPRSLSPAALFQAFGALSWLFKVIPQIDDLGLPDTWDMLNPSPTVQDYRRFAALRVAAINHALAGLPEDRIRYHICWRSWQGPMSRTSL